MRYQIILDEEVLDSFIDFLPELHDDEVYYLSLMARCDGDKLPSVKDGQIYGSRRLVKKKDIKRCLREFEVPVGTYERKGVPIPQDCLSPYITINPRSLTKASRSVAVSLTERLLNGDHVNPVDFSLTTVHKSIGTKHFLDFDFDFDHRQPGPHWTDHTLYSALSTEDEFRFRFDKFIALRTRGGIHIIVPADSVGNKYAEIICLPFLDEHGSHGMIPIPGCSQRGFMPTFTVHTQTTNGHQAGGGKND